MSSINYAVMRLNCFHKPWFKFVTPSSLQKFQIRIPANMSRYSCVTLYKNNTRKESFCDVKWCQLKKFDNPLHISPVSTRQFSLNPSNPKKNEEPELLDEQSEKLNLFQRFKKMMKEYWYVVIPVHIITSTIWFGSFFYASKCGFNIVPYLEYFNASETIIRPFRSSSLGHLALAYALYKVATPARYTVTLGGTTFAIKFLTKRGLIKPMPSKANIKAMVKQKKEEFQQRNK